MTKVSWIYFQIGRPARTCTSVAACVSAKILRVLKTASLVFRLDLLPPRYLSAGNDNEVRPHKHLHTQTLPAKDGRFQKRKKSSKQIVTTIAETGILCSVTLPRRH